MPIASLIDESSFLFPSFYFPAFSFSDHVPHVLVVLGADIFSDFIAGQQLRSSLEGPRLGIGSRIFDGGFNFKMTEVGTPDALDDVKFFCMGVGHRGPALVIESD